MKEKSKTTSFDSLTSSLAHWIYLWLYKIQDMRGRDAEIKLSDETSKWNYDAVKEDVEKRIALIKAIRDRDNEGTPTLSEFDNEWNQIALRLIRHLDSDENVKGEIVRFARRPKDSPNKAVESDT